MRKIQRALVSVSDKTGLVDFVKTIVSAGIEVVSTGGTARLLKEQGLPVCEISEYTGFPEILDGRVKTLHPKVHGGLLYKRGNQDHERAIKEHGIQAIDLVVVNLYPFEKTIARADVTLDEAIENIDIGGPSMIRSAAKNHESVTVVIDPADYELVAAEIKQFGNTTLETRRRLAIKVFARTATYDAAIAAGLESLLADDVRRKDEQEKGNIAFEPASTLLLTAPLVQKLRYGENPHQKAALYGGFRKYFEQIHGKELSYNNILDLTAAAFLISEFHGEKPTLAILKHTNPCGVGQGESLLEAWVKAYETDKQAPFGGIIAVNRPLDLPCAEAIAEIFSEVIIAPEFASDALAVLQKKKNLRLIRMVKNIASSAAWEIRSVGAESFLFQERDTLSIDREGFKVVTKREPTEDEIKAMRFGWRIVKHVKSNAIVYVGVDRTLGIGAGQMSRIDSSRIAVKKAADAGLSLKGSVVCSDAFFPFPDGLLAAADAGATAAIQPGGSVRDKEVIDAADSRGMAMVFTGFRHFKH